MSLKRLLRKVIVWKTDKDVEFREQDESQETGLCREVVKWFKVVTNDES